MSFILDALKKSEAERARQAGPALLEMRIVRPRRRVAPWIIMLALLLAANGALLLWFALRHEAAPVPAPVTAPASAPAASVAAPPGAASSALPPPGAFVADPGARVAGAEEGEPAASDNPADLEPAASLPPGSVRMGSGAGMHQNYTEVGGTAPELRLDLHVFANRPQDRYALINMHKVREGDVLPEGPRVLEITRDGVVIEWQGGQFVLGRE